MHPVRAARPGRDTYAGAVDAEAYRAESRERWERAAAGWTARREVMQSAAAPVSAWLVDAVDPRPGQRVLEVACGLGDTGLMAAARVGPDGEVLLTDGAEAMVEAARANAGHAGAANVEARQMEAEWLDVPTASVDGIVCRWGYMLVADPEAALREARRALRPGGRIALAAWEAMDRNPWIGVLLREMLGRGIAEPPEPGEPGMFAFAQPGAVEGLLQDTGFQDVAVDGVDFTWEAESLDVWWGHMVTTSISLGEALAKLSPAEHYALRDAVDAAYAPYIGEDGTVRLPARALVACASA